MMRISQPLSAGQAKTYHAEQFANAKENYYTQGAAITGQWDGRLAAAWGLTGPVHAEQFERLADGQDPHTGQPLVRHLAPHERTQPDGTTKTTVAHRAGWDLTIGAPKSVSLAALIGGDDRIRLAHREAVQAALRATEQYVQARVGSGQPSQTTGRWVAATFEHDSARPVAGYAAPHLHTHVVVFNMTELPDGKMRSLQTLELWRTTGYATAVYRSVLATRLHALGYELEFGEFGAPDIKGLSREYLEASSPRSAQMQAYLDEKGISGARATDIAALATRGQKAEAVTPDEMIRRHQAIAAQFGHEARVVVEAARAHGPQIARPDRSPAERAMDYAVARNTEREASPRERAYLRDALIRSVGEASSDTVHRVFRDRIDTGQLMERPLPPGHAGQAYTTPAMIQLERDNLAFMTSGRGQRPTLAPGHVTRDTQHLPPDIRTAIQGICATKDLVYVLDGTAGSGKTVALAAVKTAAERGGYTVEGFAPTGRAAHKLHAESGMTTSTLQKHLHQLLHQPEPPTGRHLYVLDESSLASTDQMHRFLHRLGPEDRVLLVGDGRQHQAVDAGRPFDQLQQAGVAMSTLTEIRRQTDPALLAVVHQLANHEIHPALTALDAQGRIHEIEARADRLHAVAQAYAQSSTQTLVIAPDNDSRERLNTDIRQALRDAGRGLDSHDHALRVLLPRNDLTGPDRAWAGKYAVDDVIRYGRTSEKFGVVAGEYVKVTKTDPSTNQLTVARPDGSTLNYKANRLQGVAVYRETERPFAVGDRVQFTAPDHTRRVSNRDLGTVKDITPSAVRIKLDDGHIVKLPRDQALHLEHGYAVTSHSAQGQTVDRVLIYIDPERAGQPLVNQRLAYVAVSRARTDAQIFCQHKPSLYQALNREYDKTTAIDVQPLAQKRQSAIAHTPVQPRPITHQRSGIWLGISV